MRKQRYNNQNGFAHVMLLFLLVAIVAIGYFAYQNVQNKQVSSNPSTVAIAKKTNIVTGIQFSNEVDSTGKAIAPTKVLGATDSKINVVSAINNAKKGTRIAYTRYLDNKFIDNGSLAINKDGAKYVNFTFNSNPGNNFQTGIYKIKVYANGKYQTSDTFTIK